MKMEEVQQFRRSRLSAAAGKAGGKAALGRLLGYRDGALVGQMLRGERPVTEATVAKLETLQGFRGWFDRLAQAEGALPFRDLDPFEVQLVTFFRQLATDDERHEVLVELNTRAAAALPTPSTADPWAGANDRRRQPSLGHIPERRSSEVMFRNGARTTPAIPKVRR